VASDIFDQALNEHAALIDRIIAGTENNPACREELRQEVALALWRAAPSWRRDCSLRTFVARVTHNVCVSHVRKASRAPKHDELSDTVLDKAQAADDAVVRADLGRRLQVAVSRLPHGMRQVATLYLDDFSAREIAETLGISEGAVFTRITRLREMLRKVMDTE
jgi:RNA polymerase sigma-70 factor (ECF subfamily)